MNHRMIIDSLLKDLESLRFGPPVSFVYNPLEYARQVYETYVDRFAIPPKEGMAVGDLRSTVDRRP